VEEKKILELFNNIEKEEEKAIFIDLLEDLRNFEE
jgi:predicted RNA-binding protein